MKLNHPDLSFPTISCLEELLNYETPNIPISMPIDRNISFQNDFNPLLSEFHGLNFPVTQMVVIITDLSISLCAATSLPEPLFVSKPYPTSIS